MSQVEATETTISTATGFEDPTFLDRWIEEGREFVRDVQGIFTEATEGTVEAVGARAGESAAERFRQTTALEIFLILLAAVVVGKALG